MRHGSHLKMMGVLFMAAMLAAATPPNDSPIADAAMRRDTQAVRELLRQGADANAAHGDGMTALHWAAEYGDAELARMLISGGANPRAVTRLGAYTPLHLAAKLGRAGVIRVLVESGANVNSVTTSGGTPALYFAAASGSDESVTALLEAGAKIDAREAAWGQTPLMAAAAYNHVDVMRTLVAHGADVALASSVIEIADLERASREAGQRRNRQVAAIRGDQPARPAAAAPPAAASTAARPAANAPAAEAEPAPLSYNQLVGSKGGLTPLLFAARHGNLEAISTLLDAGADVNQVSEGDDTSPLLIATINGQFDAAQYLLGRGADPNVASEAGATPLYTTLNVAWAPKALYPQPVAHMVQRTSYLELMETLLEAGADPNARLTKHLWYMSYNFDLLGVDTKGATAFWRAAYATDVPAMRLLVAYGADPHLPTLRPPGRARRGEGSDDGAGTSNVDPSGLPPIPVDGPAVYPIHAASGVGFGEGFAANAHRSAPDSWIPAVRYLVEELGADVNARDLNGYNAIHHAAARGDNELILYLVEKGADVMAVSRRGQTTVDMANGPAQRITPFLSTIALLESLGAKNNHRCVSC